MVVGFNLGRGGVPRGRPVVGQLSDTPLCAGLIHRESVLFIGTQFSILYTSHLTLCVPQRSTQASILLQRELCPWHLSAD